MGNDERDIKLTSTSFTAGSNEYVISKDLSSIYSNMMWSGGYVVQDKLACACLRNDGGAQPWGYDLKLM